MAERQNFNHFTGVDYDAKTETTAIFKVRHARSRGSQRS